MNLVRSTLTAAWIAALSIFAPLTISSHAMAQSALPAGVDQICSMIFDKDLKRPARVEDSALPCLEEAAKRLKAEPDRKLVLVGLADWDKDHEAQANGHMREKEDTTGYDVRLEDLAAYRAINTKAYLTRFYRIDPSRIVPTTNEPAPGQTVTVYLVPGSADYNHNFLGTTKINERPCTVKPCYTPDEETLQAQPRSRIPAAKPSS
jgi:hypothetical protein